MRKIYLQGLFLLTLLLVILPPGAGAIESEECLACHGDIDTVGEARFINAAVFDSTIHAELGCSSCHESVTSEHPDDGMAITKAVCLDCHGEVDDEFNRSSHAKNASCGDCHNPHKVRGFAEVSGFDMNQTCAGCHDTAEMINGHNSWLPQADLHIAKLPCVSCHTGSEEYEIVLYISQRESAVSFGDFELSDYSDLKRLAGSEDIKGLIDLNQDGFVSLTELRTFNRNPAYQAMRLQGTLTPKEITHSVKIHSNRWDCTFCHTSGPEAMQTSYLALPTGDGTYQRIEVERGAVLKALNGTPDFYMMGTTRSASLNILGVLIILGGCLLPLGHGALRFLTRNNRVGKGE
jgi:predicted CXXCH cytochrome family protein